MEARKKGIAGIAIIGVIIVMAILVLGTIWMGQSAKRDTEKAVHSVSSLYLDELAGRREQVVASNLKEKIEVVQKAIDVMNRDDLSDMEHLQAYQKKIKTLFDLKKFAFVDTNGLIYTSHGTRNDIDDYPFDYKNLTQPQIEARNLRTQDIRAIIAVPIDPISFQGKKLTICFMEIDMKDLLAGVSLQSENNKATFCNLYTKDGFALSNTVLGGLAVEDNLLEAVKNAEFKDGQSYDNFAKSFTKGEAGEVTFVYNGVEETLSYTPVEGTDWLLTYLIRENVITSQIETISEGIITRSIVQSILTILVLLAIFGYVITQSRRNARLRLEMETAETANRVKQEELEHRLALQEKLLEEERHREEQDRMITALASDYWSVYYIDLDKDEGVCYEEHADLDHGVKEGEHFPYQEAVKRYADLYVTEEYREKYLEFVKPEAIKNALQERSVISYTYLASRNGKEFYEAVRFAAVRNLKEREGDSIHAVGACITDVDAETRRNLTERQILSDALSTAEEANKAKTAFLSNMSHEIRTPMNAIIGLDNIALNDPDITPKAKDYFRRIGSSAEHLLEIINDILDMSRIESGRMSLKNEEFSISKLLEAINTIFSGQCHDKGLEYQCHILSEIEDYYYGDDMKLRQILINILGNAVKFTPAGGSVKLEIENIANFDTKSTLSFKISDTGVGISSDYLPHIFETFSQEDSSSTNKYGSSGLGMAITKSLVEMMNGTIQVDSVKGEGSVFTVQVTLDKSKRKDASASIESIPLSEMTVLVVDDDPVACQHAKLVLDKAGIASEMASSGEEAIEKVRLRHARREPYNLILIDWKMPQMDGVEATRRIRSIVGHESAIIILTAYQWGDVLDEALEAGVDSFLSKPLFASSVMEEFKSALQRKGHDQLETDGGVDLAGRKILLAEDMQVNAEIMVMTLGMQNIEADLAQNGKIALEKFESSPEGYYDAILMDMRMPEMDGLEATRRIRMLDRPDAKTIPIVALTANAFDEDVQRSLQAGLNAHLSKPVNPDMLFETLKGLLK